jgi:cysteinyl-tRNA synthetase
MHNGFVTIEGEKMSKSLGNIILVNELTDSHHGEVIRLALLSSHYRQNLDWNEKIIYQSSKLLDKLYEIKKDLKNEKTSKINHKNTDVISALADDLNTPELIVKLNKIIKEYNSSNKDKQKTKDQLDLISEALGILKDDSYKKVSQELEEKINTLIADRTKAKINRNYDLADKIRKELTDLGVEIKDTSDGTDWNLKI